MKWYNNLKISQKLTVAFTAVILILAYIGYDSIVKLKDAGRLSKSLYEDRMMPVGMFLDISNNSAEQRALTVNALTASSEKTRENKKIIAELTQKNTEIWKQYISTTLAEEEKAIAKKYEEATAAYRDTVTKVFELIATDKYADAEVLANKEVDAKLNEGKKSLDILVRFQSEEAKKLHKRIEENAVSATISSIVAIAVGILVSIGAIFLLIRTIATPINTASDMLKDIAHGEGDLTKRLKLTTADEVGEMGSWFDTFVEKIHDMVVRINQMALDVASASQRMSVTSDQMSKAIISGSDQVTSVASSMEEMSATTANVAKNATNAVDSARHAVEMAESGGKIVQEEINSTNNIAKRVMESAKTVKELGVNSERIGEIVSVIEDIADQTNLLALNAAIEAARAGEQGRGFAVVADEVRKLAERTTKATKEIAGMIKAIQKIMQEAVQSMEAGSKEVEAGVELSKKVGGSFQDIIISVKTITEMINQIAAAADEQASASGEVSGKISTISDSMKKSSVGSQQNAEVAKNLSAQASELQKMVTQFKL